ncbi:glucose-6-phosphate dehydrogenase assembly protein OpcA [Candidatus Chlorohelix sp.]|uniref:glucose-6-phosphate dehydrogenase assembly protein OpcA n=1 Tax=Candidatus Chlorohelix sp. TaxID=3139201 RepID=UPI00304D0608
MTDNTNIKMFGSGTGTINNDSLQQIIEQGQAHNIALEDIEKGITALWQATDMTRQADSEPAVMRACVLNLVICTETDEELEQATNSIARLTWTYPSRSIVLLSKPNDPEEEITAWISAHCQMPDPKGRKVCCEQITIEGRGTGAERISSMVLPLLVSDLPVTLWWRYDLGSQLNLFQHLFETADRLVVDSRLFKKPTTSFKQLADLAESTQHKVSISDLNWTRLTPWRSAISQFFDNTSFLPYLYTVDKLEIEYEAPYDFEQPNFSEALLLVGWFAKVLNWKPAFALKVRGSNASLIINRGGQPLNIEFHGHNERKDELGGITSLRIYSSLPNENREAVFTLTLADDLEHAHSKIEENGQIVSTFSALLPLRDVTNLMHEELSMVGGDSLFEGALVYASKFGDNGSQV